MDGWWQRRECLYVAKVLCTSLLYGISWKFPSIYLYDGKCEAKVFTSILERGVSAKPAITICCHFSFAKDRLASQPRREGKLQNSIITPLCVCGGAWALNSFRPSFFFAPRIPPSFVRAHQSPLPFPLNFRPVTLSNQIRQTEEGRGTELRRLFEAGPTEPRLSLVVACSAVGARPGSGRRPRKDVCRDETRGQRERRE